MGLVVLLGSAASAGFGAGNSPMLVHVVHGVSTWTPGLNPRVEGLVWLDRVNVCNMFSDYSTLSDAAFASFVWLKTPGIGTEALQGDSPSPSIGSGMGWLWWHWWQYGGAVFFSSGQKLCFLSCSGVQVG